MGGCDGVSVIKSAELIGSDPMGTMPHALVLLFGDTVEAARAFDEVIDKAARRTVLIDTFNDEKFEAVRVAEAMGDALYAVRLDTPASRRGSFFRILEEVRWELDLRGFKGVKLFVSGGIREEDIPILNPVVDAYGIGTLISNAPVLDFSMDIVEIDGQPAAKRGKWSGSKTVLRCPSCGNDIIIPLKGKRDKCGCGGERYELLSPLLEGGRLARDLPPAKEIRDKVLNSLADMES
ncbi:MAG: nicotinate phosphoribosyltransferase [Nitrospirota bacterium]